MFLGSIPQDARNMIGGVIRAWQPDDLAVGCSGNFTIERVVRAQGIVTRIHSNDVSIYSCALGWWLSRTPFRLEVKPAWQEAWGWMQPYIDRSPEGAVATLMLCTRMFDGFYRNTPYHERQRRAYRHQWDRLYEETVTKLERLDAPVDSYFAGDVVDFAQQIPTDYAFVSFPPFYRGGYEALYRALDDVFDWDTPDYELFDQDRIAALYDAVRNREHWCLALLHREPQLEQDLRGVLWTSNRGVPFYVYSDSETSRIVVPRQTLEPVMVPTLGRHDEIGTTLTLAPITGAQLNQLRSLYLDMGIAPGTADVAMAVLVDGHLIGAFAFSRPNGAMNFASHLPGPHVYMMSDFAIGGTQYRRLSKLVVMASLSKEAQRIAQRMLSRRVRSVVTTAFADNPVSMKYRGVYTLLTRQEVPEEERHTSGGHRWQLNYGQQMGELSLEEVMQEWIEKHGGVRHDHA